MRPKDLFILCTLVIFATFACSLPTPTPTPVPTPRQPTSTPTGEPPTAPPTATATPASTATPSATPTPSPTPTPAGAVCPPPGSPELVEPANFADYPAAIRQFLSAGGSVATLRDRLAAWNALPGSSGPFGESDVPQVTAADLTGDGVPEVIVAVINPSAQVATSPPGDLFVFGCEAGAYVRLYRHGVEDEEFGPTALVYAIDDANEDGLTELAYVARMCGAHTCFETLQLLGWDGNQLVSLMGSELTMPYPTYTIAPGRIEAQSGGIGSVGAEPQRTHSEIWEWNGSVFTVTETIYEPPTYRYHALLDGDRALRDGDDETARATYRRVIDDDALEEWGATSGVMDPAEERAFLSAFARWRLVLTHLQMGDVSAAQDAYNQLQAEHPPGTAGRDVAALTETFWNAYLDSDSVAAGCRAVVAATDEDDVVLQFFNQNYGYANPWWEPPDLCPFVE
jgi:hypothetical protein